MMTPTPAGVRREVASASTTTERWSLFCRPCPSRWPLSDLSIGVLQGPGARFALAFDGLEQFPNPKAE